MSLIDNDYQTTLLFKQFVGVAAARLDDEFGVEKFRSVPNILQRCNDRRNTCSTLQNIKF